MRTILTSEDIKNIVENVFNGNLRESERDSSISYSNPNSEDIVLVDEDGQEQEKVDIAKYLNVYFYNWKKRVVDTDDKYYGENQYSEFNSWVESLNLSLNQAYALVEVVDEEAVVSQDIDSSTKVGRVTFIMQTNKIKNLEYYVEKVRNYYL